MSDAEFNVAEGHYQAREFKSFPAEHVAKSLEQACVEIDRLTGDLAATKVERDRYREKVETLFFVIAHGDNEHRAWLKKAIDDHFNGKKKPTT
jgi:hypothetical protein